MLYDSIVDIFGRYSPIDSVPVSESAIVSGSAISFSSGIAYVDYTYIFMIVLVSICFFSLFKIIGGVIHARHAHL